MQPLPSGLDAGMLSSFNFHDIHGDIVGFGTQQEILDYVDATGQTGYVLSFPERGTLLLSQREEFSYLFAEIADMTADQDYVREFNPPLIHVHTVLGSAEVLGGTGEFQHEKGTWREITVINELNLETGVHDMTLILQIAHH
jgi:hypothetical protein